MDATKCASMQRFWCTQTAAGMGYACLKFVQIVRDVAGWPGSGQAAKPCSFRGTCLRLTEGHIKGRGCC
jgi:hypothetical protein